MKTATGNYNRREQAIAALLWYGTWLASAVIAVGMCLEAFQPVGDSLHVGLSGYDLVKAGVVLFILLPAVRVVLMMAIFLRERDYAYAAISALVLGIIATGVAIGLA